MREIERVYKTFLDWSSKIIHNINAPIALQPKIAKFFDPLIEGLKVV